MERVCSTCKESKPLTKEFYKLIHNKYFYKECKVCQRLKSREYMQKRRKNKSDKNKCECCNNTKLPNSRFCEEHYYKTCAKIHLGNNNK